jgi:hypothetical protein
VLKTFLKVIGVIVVLIVAGVAAIFWGSSGMVDVSDAFFKATAAGNMEQARTYLAEDFRKSTSEDELHSFLQHSALLDYAEAHWSSRAINMGGTGHLEGTVNTKSGGSVPLTIQFVKENDAWKIYSIKKSQAGLVTAASDEESPAAPSLADSGKLALATTLVFGDAVKTGDFTALLQTTSSEFQKEYTVAKFASSFAQIVDRKLDVAVAPDATPIFTTAPEMLENGVLHMGGVFDCGQEHDHLNFDYKYVYRHTQWKLLGIHVKISGAKPDTKAE